MLVDLQFDVRNTDNDLQFSPGEFKSLVMNTIYCTD